MSDLEIIGIIFLFCYVIYLRILIWRNRDLINFHKDLLDNQRKIIVKLNNWIIELVNENE